MRKFSSYGPVDRDLHYYAPREALIEKTLTQLQGDNPDKGGHYITVWAARQTGKTWLMQQVVQRLKQSDEFEVAILSMQSAKTETTDAGVWEVLITHLRHHLQRDFPMISSWKELGELFSATYLDRPLILILDEFDALPESFINKFANEFRSIYLDRLGQIDKKSDEKHYLLHGLALIGVRAVLGIENVSGSPFNVQRSLRVPNLTAAEVQGMFEWYEQESGQSFEAGVVERVFAEMQGQPGLTCWLGELLTETYNKHASTISHRDFDITYAAAIGALPNNNILNIISKAKQEPYKTMVLDLFKTDEKIDFRYDDPLINFLYMNGVIDQQTVDGVERFVKFPSPFVQKRLFNYFSRDIFPQIGQLHDPFVDLSDTITEHSLNLTNLMGHYEAYLRTNHNWLFKDAPRRSDLRLYEAIYHFNLYAYLLNFFSRRGGQVLPEFPTGNGQVDLIIRYAGQTFGLEIKSFTDTFGYKAGLKQAARYGHQLGLAEVSLVLFVEAVDEANRQKYQTIYEDEETSVVVKPVFVETGKV